MFRKTCFHVFSTGASALDNVDEREQPNVSEARALPEMSTATSGDDDNDEENDVVRPCTPPVIRKDVLCQGSLENTPIFKENIDEYHKRITIPCRSLEQRGSIANPYDKKNKSFFSKLKHEIGVKFLLKPAFLLFTFSNFMTSLGFNVPYNFAHDLAKDAHVIEEYREYVIMSIGISNGVGRIIIGCLGREKKVFIVFILSFRDIEHICILSLRPECICIF